ncbi:hypothetical protein OSTOST_10886 [Ostertagia ostertagi]
MARWQTKSKKRLKKRKMEEAGGEITEIPLQRRKLECDDEVMIVENDENKENKIDRAEIALLPTRESVRDSLLLPLRGNFSRIVEGHMGSGKTFLASYRRRVKIAIENHADGRSS